MSEKSPENVEYVKNFRAFLKEHRNKLGGNEALYFALYGKRPDSNENQTLINFINRGSLKAEFIALCADKLGWEGITLGELFKLPNCKSHSSKK